MRPIAFVKAHPVGVITCGLLGMAVGPAILGAIGKFTGVNVSIPSVGR